MNFIEVLKYSLKNGGYIKCIDTKNIYHIMSNSMFEHVYKDPIQENRWTHILGGPSAQEMLYKDWEFLDDL